LLANAPSKRRSGNNMLAPSTDSGQPPARKRGDKELANVSTFAAIRRLYPYAKPAVPRIMLAMIAALVAGVVALVIPQILGALVDGPLQSGDTAQIWPAFAIVLGLGILEAILIALRRWFVLTPAGSLSARLRAGG